ncbi:extracellular solute-binding protein [Vallitalea okinawensis]|uniref:extracellular solute-binding protein n=1 Tax=Vallitalea okinawensis TaxID=2078660 RepID=UPI0013007A86|nr:extracellular solute-binding protein [Vallitalea okinawensis]
MLKKLIAFIICMAMVFSFVGCTQDNESNDVANNVSEDVTKESDTTKSEPEKTEKKEVVVSMMSTHNEASKDEDARVEIFYDAVDKTKELNPNLKIEVEYIPHDAYQDKAQILAAADELPDLFEVKGSWTKNFVENGRLRSLNDILDSDPAWRDSFIPGGYLNFLVDDQIYGLCMDSGGLTHVIYYNEDIFNECGIEIFPETMPEFVEAIEKIKSKGYLPISMGNKGNWLAESCYLSTIGARFTGQDWNKSIVEGTGASFADPEFISGLAVMYDLALMGAFNEDLNSVEYKQQRVPYYNGEAAMFVEGNWALSSLIKDCSEEVLNATQLAIWPAVEGSSQPQNYISGGTGGWALSLNAQLEDEKVPYVTDFYQSLFTEEYSKKMYENGKTPSIQSDTYDKSKLHPLQVDYFNIVAGFEPCSTYDLVFDPAVIEVMNSGLQELLIDAISPEELADRIQKEYEDVK